MNPDKSFRQLSTDKYQLSKFSQLTLDNSLSFRQLSINYYQLSNFQQTKFRQLITFYATFYR